MHTKFNYRGKRHHALRNILRKKHRRKESFQNVIANRYQRKR